MDSLYLRFFKEIIVKDEHLPEEWEEAMSCFPGQNWKFFQSSEWKEAFEKCRFKLLHIQDIQGTLAQILSQEDLLRLLWFYTYHYTQNISFGTTKTSVPPAHLPTEINPFYFYLFVALTFVPVIWERHRRRGIPEQVSYDTISKISINAETLTTRDYGIVGYQAQFLPWVSHYINAPLFRLGRMEYWLRPSTRHFTLYRRASDGLCVLFMDDGTRCLYDGNLLSPSDPEETPTWTAKFTDDGTTVTGNPCTPWGFISQTPITLPRSEFEPRHHHGDWIAEMHIPSGGGMTVERVKDSLTQVKPFFKRFFPDVSISCIETNSWIFANTLTQILAPEANLNQVNQNLYLFPFASAPKDGLSFIFPNVPPGDAPYDISHAPQDTELRRRVATFIQNGGRWRLGGMCILTEDLNEFGTHIYQRRWLAAGLPVK